MDRLVRAKLFGDGLIPVESAQLVARYNRCLESLGIAPTTLTKFQVDGVGWSPQVAGEKNDLLYLSAGIANPMAVIISPDQRDKPLYSPYSSYDRGMMRKYFEKYNVEIADITRRSCVGLDIDQELTGYLSPADLLLVRYIIVRSSAGEFAEAGRRQQALVQKIMREDFAWFDRELRAELSANAATHGDLRFRRVEIPDFQYKLGSFYTRAFDGVFVFRDLGDQRDLLIVENPAHRPAEPADCDCHVLAEENLTDLLEKVGLVELDLAWFRRHPEVIDDKREALMAALLCANDPELDFVALPPAARKRMLNAVSDERIELLHELERLNKRIESDFYNSEIKLSRQLRLLFLRPSNQLDDATAEVVWMLLCRLDKLDVLRLYMSDKNLFFNEYRGWPNSKQNWAISVLVRRYRALWEEGKIEP